MKWFGWVKALLGNDVTIHQSVQLLIIPDGQQYISENDYASFFVSRSIADKLQDFSSEVSMTAVKYTVDLACSV